MFNIKSISGNPMDFRIKAKTSTKAEMFMYGDVSEYDISANAVALAMKDLDSKINEIDIRLMSGGGDVFQGIAIYNILKRSEKKINIYIDGLAGSIASIIMLAGDEVIIGEGSQVFIHKPWAFKAGNSNELQEMIDQLDRVENEMLKIYSSKMSVTNTQIIKMMSDETWFNDDEAIEFGLVDRKIAASTDMNIAAAVRNCDWVKKKELAKANLEFKNKIQDNINKFDDVLARK